MNNLLKYSLTDIRDKLAAGEVTSEETVRACLDRIEETKDLNTVITVTADAALERARAFDRGEIKGPLAGVPVIVKDNISTKGVRTTCASRMLENYVPPYDATVMKKLYDAGAIMIAKANMDEFAMGSGTQNSYFGGTKNAVDPTRVPGGSSGGSAAAVAAYQAYAALGSDTGGSIRQPAAFNGVVGYKPTYSVVSRYGLVAFASSLDQIGPITRTVRDAALMLKVIAGHDPLDSTSNKKMDYPNYVTLDDSMKGKRIGVPKEFFGDGLNPEIREAIQYMIQQAAMAGARIEEVSIKSFDAALATYYVLSSAEAATNLARYDGVKYGFRTDTPADDYVDMYYKTRSEGFGAEVKRRIMIGNYVLSSGYYDAYYLKALKARTLIKEEYERALLKCDCLVCPAAPTTAPAIGAAASPAEVYLSDIYTVPVNIAGLPGVTIPVGLDKAGLPIGMQLIGRPFCDKTLLNAAAAFERLVKAEQRAKPAGRK